MSTENTQPEQSPTENPVSDPKPQSQEKKEIPNQPQKEEISPDSVDLIKNLIQPLNNNISDIDLIYQKAEEIPIEEQNKIIIKEIPGKSVKTTTTTKTVTTTTTIIKDGKETSTTEKVTTVDEKKEINEGNKEGKTTIKTVIINDKGQNEENINNININKEQNEENINFVSNVTFGAPEQNNYQSTLLGSNVTFGVNNTNINLNSNINNSNMSDSADKSSETGNNPPIESKIEEDKNKEENISEIKFGFKPTQENNDIKEKEKEKPLDEKNVKFGFDNKEDKKGEMEIEPGEVKEEEKPEDKKEDKKEEKTEDKKEDKKEEKPEDKKEDKKEEKKEEPIFTKSLFENNNTSENPEKQSIFEQKLFSDNNVQSKNKIEDNNINLIPDKKINSIFDDSKNTKEIFLKNNISLIPQNTVTNATEENTEIPSAVFGQQQKTLNEIIKEGDAYNADSAKKNQIDPNFITTINPNITNEDSNINNNILSQSKGKNPFTNDNPKENIIINNMDTNDNLDTKESTGNKISLNMAYDNKKISSPFASVPNQGSFLPINQKASEVHVNPIFTSLDVNPFNSLLNENKKEKEDKNIKTNLFPGSELLNANKSESAPFLSQDQNKKAEHPIFPGTSNDLDNKKAKSFLFVNENEEKKEDKDKDNNKENNKENNNIFFSEIISEGIPNKYAEKNLEKGTDSNIKEKSNQDSYLPEVDSIILSKDDKNKQEIKEIPKEDNKELEKEKISIKENSVNNNIDNKPELEKSTENKENENPKDNELIMSNVINSNIIPTESMMKDNPSSLFNKSLFNNIDNNSNKIKEEPKETRKSLFEGFNFNNNINLDDAFSKSKIDTGILGEGKNEKLFPEPKNVFENNKGKKLFPNEQGSKCFGKVITPIKESNLSKKNDKEDKKIIINKPETKFGEEEEVLSEDEKENIPSNKEIKQKPLNKKIFSELIKKIYRITEKKKNDINIPEKKKETSYDPTLNKLLEELEEKISNLKKCYIDTLVKKHFEKMPSKKNQIILEANLPKKRNELKKVYRDLSEIIDNKLENDNKKYYYILIMNILKKYENIEEKDLNGAIKLYKKNINVLEKDNKNKGRKRDKIKDKKSCNTYIGDLLMIFLIPLIFIAYYLYANKK